MTRPAAQGVAVRSCSGDGMGLISPLSDELGEFLAKPNPSVIATLRPRTEPSGSPTGSAPAAPVVGRSAD